MVKTKTIVVYDSLTNNTKRVAEEIAATINCKAIFIDDISKHTLEDQDLIILGTPVHGARPTEKIGRILDDLNKSKHCALFCTYGAPFFGRKTADACLSYMKRKAKTDVISEFRCPGFHQIFKTNRNRPDEQDLQNARDFANGLLKKIR